MNQKENIVMIAQNMETILESARNIAVVGISDKPSRDSYGVAEYLERHGYTVIPVNPVLEEWNGKKCYPDLASVKERVDIVDIFRRPEFVPEIVDEAIAIGAGVVWMQLGIISEEGKQKAEDAGLTVVMDRCIKIEHARMH